MGSALAADIAANRGNYGRVIMLNGDSITRGFGLGVFEDAVDPSDPLYKFRSIESMLNFALEENGRSERAAWFTGLDQSAIMGFLNAGIIQSTDPVVCEDAAYPSMGVSSYFSKWWGIRHAVNSAGREFVGMTMFDYPGSLGDDTDNQFDLVRFNSTSDCGSYNDAIRRALTQVTGANFKNYPYSAKATLLDMNWRMDSWRTNAQTQDGVNVMLPDGIHPNVWGQMLMAGLIAEACGVRQYLTDLDALQDLAEANYSALSYGSTTFTGARARQYVSFCFAG